jgi:hypothetical protein
MQLFSNYNFDQITSSQIAVNELEKHIQILIGFVEECNDKLTDEDFAALAVNISWLKRFYEAVERCILNGN